MANTTLCSSTFMATLSCKLLLYIFFVCFLLPVNSIHYRFDPIKNNIIYGGDAKLSDGVIEMNGINLRSQAGWAIYPEKLALWDSSTGQLTDFTTRFSFVIDTLNSSTYGYGLTFFLAPAGFQMPQNSAGECIGLFNNTKAADGSFKSQIVLVEFDTFPNPVWDPPDLKSHVGINNSSISSAVSTPWNASFHSGDTTDVLIAYNATTKNLSVSWTCGQTCDSRENTSLFYVIDLRETLPEWATVGFSAATGVYIERHILKSWEFNSTLDMKEKNKMNAGSKIMVAVIVAVSALVVGVLVGLVILWRWKQRKEKTSAANVTSITNEFGRDHAGPRRFCYSELVSATNNFSAERKLGQGGFGAVYRGYLVDLEMTVAVKKVSRDSKQGKKEYTTEVKTCSQLRHRNLVQLIGWCHERDEFLLVYEHMPNGSLDSHLFGKKSTPLTWAVRYKISLGLASALLYLHEEWEQCVVHRDIKPSNIMLDTNFLVKLGDFGLARFSDHELGPQTTGLAGTLGYMAPEYINTGRPSKESDIYSFGIVILEIVIGRRSGTPIKENPEMGLVEWVWDLYGRGKLLSGVDERLKMNNDEQQMERLMIVGLWCAHPYRSFRPSIKLAIQVLNFETAVPNLPTKMPFSMNHVPSPSISSSEPCMTNSSFELGR